MSKNYMLDKVSNLKQEGSDEIKPKHIGADVLKLKQQGANGLNHKQPSTGVLKQKQKGSNGLKQKLQGTGIKQQAQHESVVPKQNQRPSEVLEKRENLPDGTTTQDLSQVSHLDVMMYPPALPGSTFCTSTWNRKINLENDLEFVFLECTIYCT